MQKQNRSVPTFFLKGKLWGGGEAGEQNPPNDNPFILKITNKIKYS